MIEQNYIFRSDLISMEFLFATSMTRVCFRFHVVLLEGLDFFGDLNQFIQKSVIVQHLISIELLNACFWCATSMPRVCFRFHVVLLEGLDFLGVLNQFIQKSIIVQHLISIKCSMSVFGVQPACHESASYPNKLSAIH